MHTATTQPPWYRERWPWLLAIMPTTAIILGFTFLWLAIKTDDGLVSDDYYKDGLAINKIIVRDETARRYNLGATGQLSGTALSLVLAGSLPAQPDSLKLILNHPTRKGLDHSILLTRNQANTYSGIVQNVIDARYDVTLEPLDGTWRVAGVWRPALGDALRLGPATAQGGAR
jgi:uncharacterized protein